MSITAQGPFTVTLKRDSISLSSYEVDAIQTSMESWANTISIIA